MYHDADGDGTMTTTTTTTTTTTIIIMEIFAQREPVKHRAPYAVYNTTTLTLHNPKTTITMIAGNVTISNYCICIMIN